MRKIFKGVIFSTGMMLVATVMAEPGTWWDISSKMEMEGMPFAMPAQTVEVCIPKGKEGDPAYGQGKDTSCKMTDVKKSGNKVTFKGSCVRDGETMNVSGDTTFDASGFKSNMKMSGTSRGQSMNMSMSSTGRNKGEACDTSQKDRKMQAQMDQFQANSDLSCEETLKGTKGLIDGAEQFIGKNMFDNGKAPPGGKTIRMGCYHKKAEFCSAIKRELPKDYEFYTLLQKHDSQAGVDSHNPMVGKIVSISATCNIDMENAPKYYCKQKATTGPLKFLMKYCPTEAKAYREKKRAECGEMEFSGQKVTLSATQMEQCINGEKINDDEYVLKDSGKVMRKSDRRQSDSEEPAAPQPDATSEALKQGGKVLKGLFGF